MQGAAGDVEGGFFDGFGEGGVCERCVGKLCGGEAVLEGEAADGDEFGGVGAEDMETEEFVSGGVGDDFDEASQFVCAFGAGIDFERKLAGFGGETEGCCFGFCEADVGDFRCGVDDAGDGDVVDGGGQAGDEFGDGCPFFGSFMGKHGAVNDVADGVDVRSRRLESVIDGYGALR